MKHIAEELVEATAEYANECMYDYCPSTEKPLGLSSELADIVILSTLLASRCRIDLNKAIEEKIAWMEKTYAR